MDCGDYCFMSNLMDDFPFRLRQIASRGKLPGHYLQASFPSLQACPRCSAGCKVCLKGAKHIMRNDENDNFKCLKGLRNGAVRSRFVAALYQKALA